MNVEPVARIIERIDQAHRQHPGGVVASDGDGTLWSGDVGEDFYHAFIARGDVRPEAHAPMVREAAAYGLPTSGTPLQLAERLYADYLAGRYPEEHVCELMTWCFAGWTRAEVDAFADDVIAKCGLAPRLHREVALVLEWARGAGIEIYVVSASPIAIIERAARLIGAGIAPEHVVAAVPQYDASNRMLASVDRPIPYGPGKVTNLRERLGDSRPLYAAFGDNAFDVAMLSQAFIPIAVRPKPRLRDRAHEVPGLVEIAPHE